MKPLGRNSRNISKGTALHLVVNNVHFNADDWAKLIPARLKELSHDSGRQITSSPPTSRTIQHFKSQHPAAFSHLVTAAKESYIQYSTASIRTLSDKTTYYDPTAGGYIPRFICLIPVFKVTSTGAISAGWFEAEIEQTYSPSDFPLTFNFEHNADLTKRFVYPTPLADSEAIALSTLDFI